MASPLPTGKQSVNLTETGVRGSRIRRDPPPVVKEINVRDRDEHNQRIVVVGILLFALALVIIIIGLSSAIGWSPRGYRVEV